MSPTKLLVALAFLAVDAVSTPISDTPHPISHIIEIHFVFRVVLHATQIPYSSSTKLERCLHVPPRSHVSTPTTPPPPTRCQSLPAGNWNSGPAERVWVCADLCGSRPQKSSAIRVLAVAISGLVTFPYYRFYRQNTLFPILAIAEGVRRGEEGSDLAKHLLHWKSRKLDELRFVQVAVRIVPFTGFVTFLGLAWRLALLRLGRLWQKF